LFSPQDASIVVGDTVEWTNAGEAPHTVTAESGAFDSGTVDSGERFRHRFDEAGTYPYGCAFHPQMVGRIEVTGSGERGEGATRSQIVPPQVEAEQV
ncbi:plastocyanin/azurin family copper-binding protein, partial [Actinobacillus pleuropneumoniae]|uniref:plastocyanin/azurin family copper-binding protein n=1 Tax=Actinobacillus pleuropneumoniae TaxID=715 RepID=UPI0022789F42